MSDPAPDLQAVHELDALVRNLAEELSGFRRRALIAEARLKEIESTDGGAANIELARRIAHLEQANERLQDQLETATSRTKKMLDRVKFLRQQAQNGSGGLGGSAAR